MSQDEIETLSEDIGRFIADARALLAQGNEVELTGLEDVVRALCQRAQALPQGEQAAAGERLEQLLADVTELGEELVRRRDAVAAELRGASAHRKASVAYLTGNAVDGGKKDDG